MSSQHENAMSDREAENYTQTYPVTQPPVDSKDDELELAYRQEAQYALHLLSLPAEDRPVHIMLRAKELLDLRKQHGAQEHDRAIEEIKKAGYGYDDGTGFVLKISFAELTALKDKQEVAN